MIFPVYRGKKLKVSPQEKTLAGWVELGNDWAITETDTISRKISDCVIGTTIITALTFVFVPHIWVAPFITIAE